MTLVHGRESAAGAFAIQLAKFRGARVFATADEDLQSFDSDETQPPSEDQRNDNETQDVVENDLYDDVEVRDNQGIVRKKRELTRAKDVSSLPEGQRIVVEFNEYGQAIKRGGGILGGWLGTIARKKEHCSVEWTDWKRDKPGVSCWSKDHPTLIKSTITPNHHTSRSSSFFLTSPSPSSQAHLLLVTCKTEEEEDLHIRDFEKTLKMMAPCKKWYVVFRGRVTEVFDSWDDCSRSVNGYNGNSYKSYQTFEETYVASGKSRQRAQEPFMNEQVESSNHERRDSEFDGIDAVPPPPLLPVRWILEARRHNGLN
ncbi:hypothetical protein Scep_011653 [Stephania cephalantha]|uniref:Ribonuclease H1 N-terminal domain-containing protein n=1 Tax=Stephania cephalantha TaxID=152367 RepID=A0AAP0JEJ7_9MAGN